MNNKRYRCTKEVTKSWLEENHFFHSDAYDAYIHRFSLYKSYGVTTLYGEIRIDDETYEVQLDVYDTNRSVYGPFYLGNWGQYSDEFLDIINRRIKSEFDYLGIIEDPEKSRKAPTPKKPQRRQRDDNSNHN